MNLKKSLYLKRLRSKTGTSKSVPTTKKAATFKTPNAKKAATFKTPTASQTKTYDNNVPTTRGASKGKGSLEEAIMGLKKGKKITPRAYKTIPDSEKKKLDSVDSTGNWYNFKARKKREAGKSGK